MINHHSNEYFIAVVEIIRDMNSLNAWNYAKNSLAFRLFYPSINDLWTQEGLEAARSVLFSYKIKLNESQLKMLEKSKKIGAGYLLAVEFNPQEIISCVKVTEFERIEVSNPFYQKIPSDYLETTPRPRI